MRRAARLELPTIHRALQRWGGTAVNQRTVVVDLSPRGGPNLNGIKAEKIHFLLRAIFNYKPEWKWILLTTPALHDEFATLESFGVRRHCVAPIPEKRGRKNRGLEKFRARCRHKLPAFTGILSRVWKALKRITNGQPANHRGLKGELLKQLQADLLFCPFGVTCFADSCVPAVSLWGDFDEVQKLSPTAGGRSLAAASPAMRALRMADRVACFTHHVRDEIIRLSLAEERHVVVLPGSGDGTGQLSETMQAAGEQSLDAANPQISIDQTKHFGGLEAVNLGLAELRRHGLVRHKYFHFAADFTEPSNHKLLLTAFGLFRARHPDSEWRLVCSGATNEVLEQLKRAAQLMGLGRDAIFASEGQMASRWAIMQSCGVVLFCGLETTTTISLVDALQLGKPMICSDLAGIPQAVHAAALGIDPKKPIEIAGALEQVATDETLLLTLAERSKNQAQALGGSRGAATRLLEVFQEAMESTRTLTPAFKGLFADGWTSNRFELTWPPARGRQTLNLKLFAPKLVRGRMRLHLLPNRLNPGKTFGLKRGRTTAIRLALPEHGGSLTFIVDPPIIPKELSINNDARVLGCLCRECTITGKSSRLDLHAAPLWPPVMATAVANSPVAGVYAPRTAVADCPTESLSFQELASSAGGGRQP